MAAIVFGIATAIGALVGATLGIFNGVQNFGSKRAELANFASSSTKLSSITTGTSPTSIRGTTL